MKWESAPLWPVAFPSLTGFILAFIPYLFEIDFFTTRNLLFPVFILAILGLFCFLLSDKYGNEYELYFANGGDQNNDSIPENSICREKGIRLLQGLGDKIQSSSWLLKK